MEGQMRNKGAPYSSRANPDDVEADKTIEHIFPDPINSNRAVKSKNSTSSIS